MNDNTLIIKYTSKFSKGMELAIDDLLINYGFGFISSGQNSGVREITYVKRVITQEEV